ncbi:MAG: hypothetical protein NW201_10500 [Gemmatimonadales bacterium]|nr:hypothetical protein [Gemmatimonadales bacterium]
MPVRLSAQAQLRLESATRATYSELHEGLRVGTPAADSLGRLLGERRSAVLWRRVRLAVADRAPWNDALIALTRLAELADAASADSARRWIRRIEDDRLRVPPGRDPADLIQPLRAIGLERVRRRDPAAFRADVLRRVPAGDYGLAEAWVLGRVGAGTADTLAARFLSSTTEADRGRWLTLLAFSDDTSAVPLLARVFAAPDSFGLRPRAGSRASDALLWIGTRGALQALLDARAVARARGIYVDPQLARGGYGFLDNDSSAVISRTGRWLAEWVGRLR